MFCAACFQGLHNLRLRRGREGNELRMHSWNVSPDPASRRMNIRPDDCVGSGTISRYKNWTFRGLNPGPHACEACALPLCQMPDTCASSNIILRRGPMAQDKHRSATSYSILPTFTGKTWRKSYVRFTAIYLASVLQHPTPSPHPLPPSRFLFSPCMESSPAWS